MGEKYIDLSTIKFLLYQVHKGEEIMQLDYFQDHDKQTVDLFLDSIKDFGDRELFPFFLEMDEKPARFEDGQIIVHPQLGRIFKIGAEQGLISSGFSYEEGGLQLPKLVSTSAFFILNAANNHVTGYWGLTMGAADLIASFGTKQLKEIYLKKMLGGEWQGTMCLTEPQAGSSLSDIITTAKKNKEGLYKINGQKIFISAGDHQHVNNVIHLLLARIEGAPEGTKGISLFVVPKMRYNDQKELISNDVITAGEFKKMGQKGYCTTHLIFGEKDNCHGFLVGEEHQGLKYMFQMMNAARIDVGLGAAAIASAAYYSALSYANERPQGRRIMDSGKKDLSMEPTLIINHPDIRRLLLQQKAISEGAMSIVMQASYYYDQYKGSTDPKEKSKYHNLLEILTPIAKTYPSDAGKWATDAAIQVLGGYGYVSDYLPQQYFRDIRIFSLYEGTSGIQSLDLLGRKMTMNDGEAANLLSGEIIETINKAKSFDLLTKYADILGDNLKLVKNVMDHLMKIAGKGEYEKFLSDASVFMEFMSIILVGWQWLKIGTASYIGIEGNEKDKFYHGKIHTMKFFYKYEMLKTKGLAEVLMSEDILTLKEESPDLD